MQALSFDVTYDVGHQIRAAQIAAGSRRDAPLLPYRDLVPELSPDHSRRPLAIDCFRRRRLLYVWTPDEKIPSSMGFFQE